MASRAPATQALDVARIGLQERARDLVERLRQRQLGGARLERRGVDRARRLVEHGAHGRVGRLLEHHPQPRAVQRLDVGPGRGPQQPEQDGDVVQRVAQRPDAVGIADPALAAGRLDLGAARGRARHGAHRVTLGHQRARQRQAAAAAADHERPHDGGSRRARRRSVSAWSSATRSRRSLLGQLRLAAGAPAAVDRLAHLVHVVDLVLDLELGRARGAPVELLGARARIEAPEQEQGDEQERDPAQHDRGEGIHGRCAQALTGAWASRRRRARRCSSIHATSGWARTNGRNCHADIAASTTSVFAVTVALRGPSGSSRASSPT